MNIRTLFDRKKCVLSFEIFPPKTTSSVETITDTLAELSALSPDYVSITYGAGGTENRNLTAELAKLVKGTYGIEPLAHLTCMGNDRAGVSAILDDLAEGGIENVLALRGDRRPGLAESPDFSHASDLVSFIRTDGRFNVVGACYPEGHFESENAVADIFHLKKKVDCGATHLNTQLFFDNEDFYRFSERIALAGIEVPVQAGIMPIVRKQQIERTISLSGVKIPAKFSRLVARFGNNPDALRDAGIAYATEQIADLIASGVRGIHLYIMNNIYVARKITENVGSLIANINASK